MNFNELTRIINQALSIYSSVNKSINNQPNITASQYRPPGYGGYTSHDFTDNNLVPRNSVPHQYIDKIKSFLFKQI